jgi:prevent-host-death family protein
MKTELVTSLKRNATERLADLSADGEPILITQHGRPAAYLVDVEEYERLQRKVGILEIIARGEKAVRTVAWCLMLKRRNEWHDGFAERDGTRIE